MIVVRRKKGRPLGYIGVQIAVRGTVDHNCSGFDVADQVGWRKRREGRDHDVGRFEEMLTVRGSGLRVDHNGRGADAHEHALQRNADAR